MNLEFTESGWEQCLYWQQTDPRMVARINDLLRDCRRSPFSGIGKPEALRGNFKGWWSRRINEQHRLVYRVDIDRLIVSQCRFHYEK